MLLFPLRLKLSLLTSVLLIGTIGTVSLLVTDRLTDAIEEQARERVQFMAFNLAENARDAMLAQEELVLDQLLRSVAQPPWPRPRPARPPQRSHPAAASTSRGSMR